MVSAIKPFIILLVVLTLTFIFYLISASQKPTSDNEAIAFLCLFIIIILWALLAIIFFVYFGYKAYQKLFKES